MLNDKNIYIINLDLYVFYLLDIIKYLRNNDSWILIIINKNIFNYIFLTLIKFNNCIKFLLL